MSTLRNSLTNLPFHAISFCDFYSPSSPSVSSAQSPPTLRLCVRSFFFQLRTHHLISRVFRYFPTPSHLKHTLQTVRLFLFNNFSTLSCSPKIATSLFSGDSALFHKNGGRGGVPPDIQTFRTLDIWTLPSSTNSFRMCIRASDKDASPERAERVEGSLLLPKSFRICFYVL